MNDGDRLIPTPETVARTNVYGMTFANLKVGIVSRCGTNSRNWDVQHDEYCTNMKASSKDESATTGSARGESRRGSGRSSGLV